MVFSELLRYSISIGYSISVAVYPLICALTLGFFEKSHDSALWSVRKMKGARKDIRGSAKQRRRQRGTRLQPSNNSVGAPTVSLRYKRLGVRRLLWIVGVVWRRLQFLGVGVYDELFGKFKMGELRAGDESLFEAVEGDKFFGVEDDCLNTLTACTERV